MIFLDNTTTQNEDEKVEDEANPLSFNNKLQKMMVYFMYILIQLNAKSHQGLFLCISLNKANTVKPSQGGHRKRLKLFVKGGSLELFI